MMTYPIIQHVSSIREALRVIGITSDMIDYDGEDSIEIDRSWLIEFNTNKINLHQIVYFPGTREDPPYHDYEDVASINRNAHPDAVAEYLVTQIAHEYIQSQLIAYGEAQFESEMRNNGCPRESLEGGGLDDVSVLGSSRS